MKAGAVAVALLAGLIALAVVGWAATVWPARAALAWLVAWAWGWSLALGALTLLMVSHVAPIRWMRALHPALAAAALTLPLFAVLFVPLALAPELVYPWARPIPDGLPRHVEAVLRHREPWLSAGWFQVRAAAAFVVPVAFAVVLHPSARAGAAARGIAAVGLVALAGVWTFASFDWLMSLEPAWQSRVYGVRVFSGGFVGAVALSALLARFLEVTGGLARLPDDTWHALGRLLLAFVVFWAYIAYVELFVAWIAHLPIERIHWVPRLDAWVAWAWVLGVAHWLLPTALLLSRPLKRDRRVVAAVSAWLLLAHAVDVAWLVLPGALPDAPVPWWGDVVALLAVAGLGGAALLAQSGRVPDRLQRPALEYESR